MRILIATDSIREPLTGVGRVTLGLLRELMALGHDVVTLDWRRDPMAEAVAGRGVVLPPRLPWAKTALWHLELLRRVRPDFAADVVLDPTGYPCALGRHPGFVPMVHDLHMLERGFYRRGKRTWFRLLLPGSLRRARLVVCPSQHTRRALLQRLLLDPERVVVVPNSLDASFASQEPAAATTGTPYLLAVGTVETRKNVHRLAEAYAQARARGLDARLVLAGRPGRGCARLRARVAAGDLRGHVELRGAVSEPELRALYRGALALVFPSLEEGFGLPILEAFACGTPVLTSCVSATAEVAGDAALLVDPTDTAAIRDGLLRLGSEPALRAELVARGRARVELFTPAAQARALAAALDRLCPGPSTRPPRATVAAVPAR